MNAGVAIRQNPYYLSSMSLQLPGWRLPNASQALASVALNLLVVGRRGHLQKLEAGPRCPDLRNWIKAPNSLVVKIHDAGGWTAQWPIVRAPRV